MIILCSYVLDSPDQQVAAVGKERPVTLEYVDNVEQQMTKVTQERGENK